MNEHTPILMTILPAAAFLERVCAFFNLIATATAPLTAIGSFVVMILSLIYWLRKLKRRSQ